MSKLKSMLPKVFGSSKESKKETPCDDKGKLETDALPVDDTDRSRQQLLSPAISNTPSVSTELSESAVRELSNPNYHSTEIMRSPSSDLVQSTNGANTMPVAPIDGGPTLNTMNVHNAQQQVVMQFSNAQNLHFGSVYNFNSNITATANLGKGGAGDSMCTDEVNGPALGENIGKRLTPRKTTSIAAMMQAMEEPNHRMLDTVATHLGEGWKQVMRDLGHSDGQIEQAMIDHQVHGGIKEVIYQLLLQWQRNADDGEATLGHLTTMLWETNHRDCVQRMKLVWKSEVNRKTSR